MGELTGGGHGGVPPELLNGTRRVFRAASMREVLTLVKRAIGTQALILSTRDLGQNAASPAHRFEVVATDPPARVDGVSGARRERPRTSDFADGPPLPPPSPRSRRQRPSAGRSTRDADRDGGDAELGARLGVLEGAIGTLNGQLSSLVAVNESLRDELTRLGAPIGPLADLIEEGPPDVRAESAAPLIEAGLTPDMADQIVGRALRRVAPRRGVAIAAPPDIAGELERSVRVTTPLWRLPAGAVCALIGPTGGGKSLTLLKILTLALHVHKRSVACVTTDVDRIGPYHALAAYCQQLELPLANARDRGELDEALEEFADVDLVVIDTPGHNPFDDHARTKVLDVVAGREVTHHLVLPATLDGRRMGEVIERYAGPALSSLIVSKVDEARSLAPVVAACLATDVPVSHICYGQELPDDIEAADRKRIAEEILARAS